MQNLIAKFMPEVASAHGAELDHVMVLVHWLMAILFVGWSVLFVYMLVRYRKRKNARADHEGVKTHASSWAEGAVALVEAILLLGFSIPLYSARVDDIPDESESLVVRVVAEQFAWNVHYPGPDGVFGRTDPALIDATTNPLGLDREDEAAQDDVTTINQLHLVKDQPVIVHLSSKDVIHSFMLPEMRVKQDAIPGLSVPVWFVPTVTTEEMRERTGDEEFTYEIACAQLCGMGHYRMRGFMTVHEQADFDAWMQEELDALVVSEEDAFWE